MSQEASRPTKACDRTSKADDPLRRTAAILRLTHTNTHTSIEVSSMDAVLTALAARSSSRGAEAMPALVLAALGGAQTAIHSMHAAIASLPRSSASWAALALAAVEMRSIVTDGEPTRCRHTNLTLPSQGAPWQRRCWASEDALPTAARSALPASWRCCYCL